MPADCRRARAARERRDPGPLTGRSPAHAHDPRPAPHATAVTRRLKAQVPGVDHRGPGRAARLHRGTPDGRRPVAALPRRSRRSRAGRPAGDGHGTGHGLMTGAPEPGLDDVAALFPQWEVWRGVNGLAYAR